ncbi:unnamed protein product [Nesidiocoris tenuis]|uniref:Uncharacterized protein n=1 Tax=Nesidiocoris tenuis TaxID=355587 RepID=A0A6H5FW53_9HEMI|nr:unnamed protein product [Nesidiocoris tenuis]
MSYGYSNHTYGIKPHIRAYLEYLPRSDRPVATADVFSSHPGYRRSCCIPCNSVEVFSLPTISATIKYIKPVDNHVSQDRITSCALHTIEDLADPSIIGDAVMMARKTKPSDEKKTQTVLPKAASDAPPAVTKKILQKHAGIRGLNVPAKMSRENIGMSEKIEDYEMINQPAKDHFDIGTPKQTDRILQDSKDFLMHAVLLILVTTIGTHMVPISRYYFHDIISHFLTDSIFVTETELRKNFWDISLYVQIWNYFRGILIPLVYSGLDGKIAAKFKFKNHENLLLLNGNLLVTLPRIRQVRVRNDSCDVLEGFMYLFNSCYFSFAPDLEDKEPFGLKNGTLWTYSDPSVTKAGTVQGDISTYTGGGYYMDFSPKFEKTLELYWEMLENSWIDHGTRAIIIDLASYTQRDNLFSIVTLVMELPPAGGVSTFSDVRIQRLLKYETVEDFVILGLELALVTLLLLLTVDSFVKFVQQPLRYTLNLWNTVDWLLLALGYATIAVGVWRYWTVHERLDELLEAIRSKKHFSFYLVKEVQTRYENLFACFAFVAWLKTCRAGVRSPPKRRGMYRENRKEEKGCRNFLSYSRFIQLIIRNILFQHARKAPTD